MKTLFLGDVCPIKKSKETFRRKDVKTLFDDVPSIMENRDFITVNLECSLTESTEKIQKFGPALNAPRETAEVLKNLGVNLCGLSNNHIFDLGIKGVNDTIAALNEAGIDYTGFGNNYEDSRKNYIFACNGEKICIVAVCEHEYSYALENRMGARPYDEFDTMQDIRDAKKSADRVVVLYHGGKEFAEYPSPRLNKLCHEMVKCGADLVICQHSHCIGCYEKYMDSHIVYGQGNFHFLDPDPHESWYTALAVEYDTKANEISFIPIRTLEDGITLAKGEDKINILAAFEKRNNELKTGEWRQGWRDFCESVRESYCKNIATVCLPESTERENAVLGHYLDCEAHSDVLRELFKTWNHINCISEQ